MYTLNIIRAIKRMSVNNIRDFFFEKKYYKRILFSKEDSYYLMKRWKRKYFLLFASKLIEKSSDP